MTNWKRYNNLTRKSYLTKIVPFPPGYMHLKARPRSSACFRPAGVNSPPHFNINSSVGLRNEIGDSAMQSHTSTNVDEIQNYCG